MFDTVFRLAIAHPLAFLALMVAIGVACGAFMAPPIKEQLHRHHPRC